MGHGKRDRWDNWSYLNEPWTINHALALQNNDKRPLIYNHACWTGQFEREELCLCEAFMNAPEGGAIGVFGCTRPEYQKLAYDFDKAMWAATFPTPVSTPQIYRTGDIQNYADVKLLTLWPDPCDPHDWADAYFTVAEAIWFGDPCLEVWTEVPKDLFVEHLWAIPVNIPVDFEVLVEDVNGPLEYALVTLYKSPEIYESKLTPTNGTVVFEDLTVPTTGTMKLTVTARNYIPYQEEVAVIEYDVDIPLAHTKYSEARKLLCIPNSDDLSLSYTTLPSISEPYEWIAYTFSSDGGTSWAQPQTIQPFGVTRALL